MSIGAQGTTEAKLDETKYTPLDDFDETAGVLVKMQGPLLGPQ